MAGYSGVFLSSQLYGEAQIGGSWFKPVGHKADPIKNNQCVKGLVE
jgi:hypothetical protein